MNHRRAFCLGGRRRDCRLRAVGSGVRTLATLAPSHAWSVTGNLHLLCLTILDPLLLGVGEVPVLGRQLAREDLHALREDLLERDRQGVVAPALLAERQEPAAEPDGNPIVGGRHARTARKVPARHAVRQPPFGGHEKRIGVSHLSLSLRI